MIPRNTLLCWFGWKTQCLSSTWDKSMAMTCSKWPKPPPHTATVAKNPFRWTARIVYRVFLMKLIETCTTVVRLPSLFITFTSFTLNFLAHLGESSTKQYQTVENDNQKQWKLLGSTLHTCPSWRNKFHKLCVQVLKLWKLHPVVQKFPPRPVKKIQSTICIGIGYAGYALLPGFRKWSNSFKLMTT